MHSYSVVRGPWFVTAVTVTLLSAIIYAVAQHSMRISANEPQAQMANDIGVQLGKVSTIIPPATQVDIATTYGPFTQVYSDSGDLLTSEGLLQGSAPHIPQGVLNYARDHGLHKLTWQPAANVRLAAVVSYFHGPQSGFVVVARSLAQTEKNEVDLIEEMLFGWLGTLLITWLATYLTRVEVSR